MAASTQCQVWALIRRYLIKLRKTPIRSFIRVLLWPGLIVGLVSYLSSNLDKGMPLEEMLNMFSLCITLFQFYHFCEWMVKDKATGFKSLMMSMGLTHSSHYIATSISFIACIGIPIMILAAIAIFSMFVETKASMFSILLLFILFIFHLTGLIFAMTTFITSTMLVPIIFILLLLSTQLHLLVKWLAKSSSQTLLPYVLFLGSISPYESIQIFCDSYSRCKNCDETKVEDDKVSQPTYLILLSMAFWSILAFAFARWFDEVCPWQNDSPVKKPFFCCVTEKSEDNSLMESKKLVTSKLFEKNSQSREVGIYIERLTKVFNKIPVVNDLSLNIHKGETTLLLGHNGAGKTTLMNMILGKLNPDKGRVTIKTASRYSSVGVCPQTSIWDDLLSVQQHMELFTDIKTSSLSGREKFEHIESTIHDVGLTEHVNKIPSELSGGMLRKLSLGLAFVGKSNVLILDEPSSGLDPDSRVSVWNAIRRYRADRTVLLSTQHMEEADYLGDRIAIMNAGRVVCCGSSTFLNNVLGTGYKLRIGCFGSKKKNVLKFVRKYFKNAQLSEGDESSNTHDDHLQDIVIELSHDSSQDSEVQLIEMLEKLESRSRELNINSFGLRSSSIEDVMLNTERVVDHPLHSISLDMKSTSRSALINKLRSTGHDLTRGSPSLLKAMISKNLCIFWRDWKMFLLYRVLLPVLAIYNLIPTLDSYHDYNFNLAALIIFIHYVQQPVLERVSKFKIMQLTSYGNFQLYWLAQLISDLVNVIIPMISANIFLAHYFEGQYISSEFMVQALLSVSVLFFAASTALLSYVASTVINSNPIGFMMLVYASSPLAQSGLLVVLSLIREIGSMREVDLSWISNIAQYFFITFLPTDTFMFILYGFNDDCYIKTIEMIAPLFPCYQAAYSPLKLGFMLLSAQIIFYGFLLYLIERKILDLSYFFQMMKCCRRGKSSGLPEQEVSDLDVIEENTKATRLINSVPAQTYSLVVANLSKSYVRGVKAVDHLSFAVEKGECFGLLGVNGAGKTTTFSMLVGETRQDSGRIWLNGWYSGGGIDEYQQKLGYDPQHNPDMCLSPVEALSLMARLRKVSEADIPSVVETILEMLDMKEHAHKPASELSGGTKRKLALGMSLIGNPSLLALDEPTAGVDPMARRGIWQLLRSLRTQNGVSIVISSHAMEECEAICDRISIMARGKLRCIGTFLHLRSKFSKGCSVRIQFSGSMPDVDRKQKLVDELKHHLRSAVGSVKLVDTNVNSATFSISDNSVRRSALFKILREFKQKFSNLSYMVNDSSLEDIFIALAREQQELERSLK